VSDETPESLIPYDEIVQDALRAVVGRVLGEVERSGGLPGDHHFYITFKTRAPGVSIPKHLLERFPDEMTIVIQHRFWDLKVEEDDFTVGLSFGGVPATLHVPFAAVTQFHDPAVEFALTFHANADDAPGAGHEAAENDSSSTFKSQNRCWRTIVISSGKRSIRCFGIETPGILVLKVM